MSISARLPANSCCLGCPFCRLQDLGVPVGDVDVGLSTYLALQGAAALLWNPLVDRLGRRPVYMASLAVCVSANMVLSFTPNLGMLIVFRGMQAGGSAYLASLGNGVLQDVAAPDELLRVHLPVYQGVRHLALLGGPVLGGLLARGLGFRAVFVFLLVLSALVLVVVVAALPETARHIAGNGSLTLHGVHRPLVSQLVTNTEPTVEGEDRPEHGHLTGAAFLAPLALLGRWEVVLMLGFYGFAYAVWTMAVVNTAPLLRTRFGLDEGVLGVAYLPTGFGSLFGAALASIVLSRDLAAAHTEYQRLRRARHHLPPSRPSQSSECTSAGTTGLVPPPTFIPTPLARLRHLPWQLAVFIAATAAYGWTLSIPTLTDLAGWLAVPLLVQGVLAATGHALLVQALALADDMAGPGHEGNGGPAVAKLVMGAMAAVGAGMVERMVTGFGAGMTFAGLGLGVLAGVPAVRGWWLKGSRAKASDHESDHLPG